MSKFYYAIDNNLCTINKCGSNTNFSKQVITFISNLLIRVSNDKSKMP